MNDQALVTVVVPCFNRASSIGRALDSILCQTFSDWTCVVIDDGSTDRTRELLDAYEAQDQRFRVIAHRPNVGAQASRNRGISAARSRWVAFLDSDDEWLPHSLETRLAAAARENRHVVHSECLVRKGNAVELFNVPPMADEALVPLLWRPGPMFQGLLVDRDLLLRIGLLDEDLVAYQEWDTSIRLAERAAFEFVDEPTFIYDRGDQMTISGDLHKSARGYEQVVKKHRGQISSTLGRTALAWHYRGAASLYRKAGRRRDFIRCSLKSKTLHLGRARLPQEVAARYF